MTQWVTRRDVEGKEVSPPERCLRPDSIAAERGLRTTAHCIAAVLDEGEVCQGESNKRPILKAGVFVGYIDITEHRP